ncbi:MAG: sulfurtransferase, partial [Pseudomonadales bacterium]
MALQAPTQLITVAELQDAEDTARVFDCTVHLRPDPPRAYRVESGLADYEAGHIPGAAFLDLQGTLSDNEAPHRFTRLEDEALGAAFAAEGVVDGAAIVLYSSGHPMWATRVWWMLRALGVSSKVLDGGLAAWKAAGAPLATGQERYAPGTLTIAPKPALWADQAAVLGAIDAPGVCTINALAPEVYRGDGGANYGRRGHIT